MCLRNVNIQSLLGRHGALSVEQLSGTAPEVAQDVPLHARALDAGRAFFRASAVVLTLAGPLAAAITSTESVAQEVGQDTIKDRNNGVSRVRATRLPLSEADQALVDGWPLYRTERAQAAFNDAMATLKATDGDAPAAGAFTGCAGLECNLSLPPMGADGWIPPGRIWVSPTEFVLIVHSPRLPGGQSYRRRVYGQMKYFVFHEFQNSSRNTDPYDTLASHTGSVYVPLYMSKRGTDAKGRRFVVVLQVAPYDVLSIHASNKGSAGPGMECAINASDAPEPLQVLAGILVATIIKTAAPYLQVVNHRGTEGLPMLSAYERRIATLQSRPGAPIVVLPFVPAPAQRVATATGSLADLIERPGASPRIAIAKRGKVQSASLMPAPSATEEPRLIEPITPAVRPACATSGADNAQPCP
jgi:hypothetical protein